MNRGWNDNIQNMHANIYIKKIKNNKIQQQNISSFLSNLYEFRQKCGFDSSNDTEGFLKEHIKQNTNNSLIIFKLKYIIREYISKCNFDKLKELLINIFSLNLTNERKIIEMYFFFLTDELVSSKCINSDNLTKLKEIIKTPHNIHKKKSRNTKNLQELLREEGMELNPEKNARRKKISDSIILDKSSSSTESNSQNFISKEEII
jgi:hypothetical protein